MHTSATRLNETFERNRSSTTEQLFNSFFIGGFECSTHRRSDGKRLDMIAATGHDIHLETDYARLAELGIRTAREGIRWHLIEQAPGEYDFSSVLPTIRAARDAGIQVLWDICHYGWPDDIDPFRPEFIGRFARLARAFTRLLREESDAVPFLAPVNEISFLAWKAGDMGEFAPYATGRGDEMKAQLVRATIEGIEAIWDVIPEARIVQIDPVFHLVPTPPTLENLLGALDARRAQFQAWDMIRGDARPELGGDPKYLDIIGLNYYADNQWTYPSDPESYRTIYHTDERYRPFRSILAELHDRYRRPLFVAETGTEGEMRASWLRYVGEEVRAAIENGAPVEGICLYPIVDFPGWENNRHCQNGLWSYADACGARPIHQPLADALLELSALPELSRCAVEAM